jgi:hypothetical protein
MSAIWVVGIGGLETDYGQPLPFGTNNLRIRVPRSSSEHEYATEHLSPSRTLQFLARVG